MAKVLSNVWQECCLTFEKGLFNVWKRCYPTFGNGVIQRLIMVLSNVWQRCYLTFDNNIIKAWEKSDKLKPPYLYFDMYAQSESPVEDSWRFTWSEWCSKGVWNLKVSNTTQNRELLWVRMYWCSSVRNLLKTEITERTVKRNDGGGEVCVANRCLQTYSVLLHNINRWKRYVACTNVILLLDININRCTIYWCIKTV